MPRKSRNNWTEPEELALISLVNEHGTKSWPLISEKISESFQTRSGKQCRERWHDHLNPAINKSPWSLEEQNLVFNSIKVHGYHWAKISKIIPGRTENAIKNYFYSAIRKNLRRLKKKLVLMKNFEENPQKLLENRLLKLVVFCNSEESERKAGQLKELLMEVDMNFESFSLDTQTGVSEQWNLQYSQWNEYWSRVMGMTMNLSSAFIN